MTRNFIITGLATTFINLFLNTIAYLLVLKDFFHAHPAGSQEFMDQLVRKPDQLIWWAMIATSLAMGSFITLIIQWSGARTFLSGLRSGTVVGFLYWSSVNFGLYASSNHFSLASTLVDLIFSGVSMAVSAACAAWMLGR